MADPASGRVVIASTPKRREGTGSGHLPKHPSSRWARWAVRLLLAAPFLVLTALLAADRDGYFFTGTANATLVARVAEIPSFGLDIDILTALYPPVTTLVALIVPGGVVGLGVAGALAAGFFLQRVYEWLRRLEFRVPDRVILMLTLAATPLFAAHVTTNLEIALGLILFGLGMIDVVRFIVYANTQAGFRSGLYFAAAALSAPAFVLSVLIVGAVVPFLTHSRRGAHLANALVLVFPTVAAFATVTALGVVFRNDVLFVLGGRGLELNPHSYDRVTAMVSGQWGWLYFVPAIVGIIAAIVARRPMLALMPPLVTVLILVSVVYGATPQSSGGIAFVLLVIIGIALVPRSPHGSSRALVIVIAVTQLVVGWTTAALLYPATQDWMEAVTHGWMP